MIKTDELRGIFAKNRKSQADVAKMLGITPKTFYGALYVLMKGLIEKYPDNFSLQRNGT